MASSSKPALTDEEFEANKRQVKSYSGSGKGFVERGQPVNIDRHGVINVGNDLSDQYRFNDVTGKWHANGGGIMEVGEMPVAAAPVADAAPVGAPPPAKPDWRDNVDMTQGEGSAGSGDGLTTDEIVDNSGMQNWMATGPQTAGQHVNPLVDPGNWQYQVDPANQRVRNLGRYRNPMLDEWMNPMTPGPMSMPGLLPRNTGGLLNG